MNDTISISWRTAAFAISLLLVGGCGTEPPRVEYRPVAEPTAAEGDAAAGGSGRRAGPPSWRRGGVVGPGDQVEVFVWGYPDFSRRATVGFNGTLPHPALGDLQVSGKSVAEVEDMVRKAVGAYVKAPVIKVTVASNRPQRVQVLGEVLKPGVYTLSSPDTSLVESLAQAGGPTPDARLSTVLVVRDLGKQVEIHTIDYRRLTREGDLSGNLQLADGDIVFVPLSTFADITREAARISQVISTVLLFQNVTLLWEPFRRALLNREPLGTTTTNPIVVTQ